MVMELIDKHVYHGFVLLRIANHVQGVISLPLTICTNAVKHSLSISILLPIFTYGPLSSAHQTDNIRRYQKHALLECLRLTMVMKVINELVHHWFVLLRITNKVQDVIWLPPTIVDNAV